MKTIYLRFDNTLLATLARIRDRNERFQRRLADRPTGVRVAVRGKNPEADLRRHYRRTFAAAAAIAAAVHIILAAAFPSFEITVRPPRREQVMLKMEDIPQTRQVRRPPPPQMPAVPMEVEGEDVPDDVTIESTDLDLDRVPVDLAPPPPETYVNAPPPAEDEPVEFWKVEQKPELIDGAAPEYPPIARDVGLEGTVFVKLLVGKDGRVEQASVVRGKDIFQEAALKAARQFVFKPGLQNGRIVKVWMLLPVRFHLTD